MSVALQVIATRSCEFFRGLRVVMPLLSLRAWASPPPSPGMYIWSKNIYHYTENRKSRLALVTGMCTISIRRMVYAVYKCSGCRLNRKNRFEKKSPVKARNPSRLKSCRSSLREMLQPSPAASRLDPQEDSASLYLILLVPMTTTKQFTCSPEIPRIILSLPRMWPLFCFHQP